jgi:hypothetical protein
MPSGLPANKIERELLIIAQIPFVLVEELHSINVLRTPCQ